MLGADGIYVELAGEAFELRPSLRACMNLVRRHQLFGLLAAAQDFNTTIIADMLRETGINPALLMADITTHGLGKVRNRLTGPLIAFVWAIAGVDPDNVTQIRPANSKPTDPEQTFAQLFGIATGWMSWAPEEAWNATPAEIIAAKSGRTDLIIDILHAVFGKSEGTATDTKPDIYTAEQLQRLEEGGLDPAFDRDGLAALKAKL